ncbi:thiamine-phosphate kinase [Granulicella cerasi]|uniref:Thiamine-monophosphate kinase n=1 Tax=Granulicella cerasi TaxID=741063 RepID=A0ABW1Z6Q5_9BACT|nr:thiamine-phosphate kinase [Granulicella cerasi]
MPKPTSTPRGEFALIEQIRRRTAGVRSSAIRLGIGDDCAVIAPPAGSEIVVTTDFSLEGRHFTRDRHTPESVGHRLLARGVSDLAAMGATPLAAFLSLALPKSLANNQRWLDGMLSGFAALAKDTRTPLAGGDTSQSPDDLMLADIILLGHVPQGTALLRSGAKAGDAIYVTGALGGAAAELEATLAGKRLRGDAHPHLFPQPRLKVGDTLRARSLATACMDISDGLSSDLPHLCERSGVSAEIELANLPLHTLTAKRKDALELALHGGEDYELLFTAKPSTRMPSSIAGVSLTRIGTITRPRKNTPLVTAIAADGTRTPLERGGWEHLR